MNVNELFERMAHEISVVRKLANLPPMQIVPAMSLIEDLGLDSLMFIDLSIALERAFGVELSVQDWADAEAVRQSERYTVLSLLDWVVRVRAAATVHGS
jgi:acyl carrier protein